MSESDVCKCKNGRAGCGYGYTCDKCEIESLVFERDDTREIIVKVLERCDKFEAERDVYKEALEAILTESLKVRRSDMPPHMWGAVMNAKAILSKARGEL